jgi:Raffinose synthase or seed imbibition protein Sip1
MCRQAARCGSPVHCLESGDGNAQSASGLCPVWGAIQRSLVPGAAGALLKRLVLPDGSVLRAARPALPTRDTLFCDVLRDRRTLLKVGMQIQAQCSTSCCASQTPALRLCCMFMQHTELVTVVPQQTLVLSCPMAHSLLLVCCRCGT